MSKDNVRWFRALHILSGLFWVGNFVLSKKSFSSEASYPTCEAMSTVVDHLSLATFCMPCTNSYS